MDISYFAVVGCSVDDHNIMCLQVLVPSPSLHPLWLHLFEDATFAEYFYSLCRVSGSNGQKLSFAQELITFLLMVRMRGGGGGGWWT